MLHMYPLPSSHRYRSQATMTTTEIILTIITTLVTTGLIIIATTPNRKTYIPVLSSFTIDLDALIRKQIEERTQIMADLSALIAQVKANTDLEASAIQCINGLASKLEEARGSQTAIDGVITEMRTRAAALSAAIKANTEPPPAPVEPIESSNEKGTDPTE